MARLVELTWTALDELDPIARDLAGAPGGTAVWPPATPTTRAEVRTRLDPIRSRLARIDPQALSPPWRTARTLLERRLREPDPARDALALQMLVGRGLWASLGPEAWPAARRIDRLEALGYFLTDARTATVASTPDRVRAALELLDGQRAWIANLEAPRPNTAFANKRDLAVAALDVHEVRLQETLQASTTPQNKPPRAALPWQGRWVDVPEWPRLEDAAALALAEVQATLLRLGGRSSTDPTPVARAEAIDDAEEPELSNSDLAAFLGSLGSMLGPTCPAPPTVTATTAPASLFGLAAVRLDEVQARTSTTAYRLWLSVASSEIVERAYPPEKIMALALFEGWPGRALRHWAINTRQDRGMTERRWADPVLAEGWPLFALDRLLAPQRVPPAVRWQIARLQLRAIVDAQVDLWARRPEPLPEEDLREWLTSIGGMAPAEARRKLQIVRHHPGRLAAPFLGWLTLEKLADQWVSTPDAAQVRRFAACTEWPPDLMPTCLNPEP